MPLLLIINSLRLAAVYLPPGVLKDEDVAERLSTFGPLDVIIGDINARHESRTGRAVYINEWLAAHDPLLWLLPEAGEISRWRHLLADPSHIASYTSSLSDLTSLITS